jgi:hypothetical protein
MDTVNVGEAPSRILKKSAFLTRPTPARRDAPFTERRSRVALKKRER